MPVLDELRARLHLLRFAEPPAPALHAYVAVHGPVETVTAIRAGTAPPAVLAEATRKDADITADLRAVDSGVARLVTPEDPEWPAGRLDALSRPGLSAPLGLWVRGQVPLDELVRSAVTITGARAATDYGRYVATDFSYGLATLTSQSWPAVPTAWSPARTRVHSTPLVGPLWCSPVVSTSPTPPATPPCSTRSSPVAACWSASIRSASTPAVNASPPAPGCWPDCRRPRSSWRPVADAARWASPDWPMNYVGGSTAFPAPSPRPPRRVFMNCCGRGRPRWRPQQTRSSIGRACDDHARSVRARDRRSGPAG